ncbi:MAG: hypothetical protein RJQ14_04405, partial [Marinoscillum sp.]
NATNCLAPRDPIERLRANEDLAYVGGANQMTVTQAWILAGRPTPGDKADHRGNPVEALQQELDTLVESGALNPYRVFASPDEAAKEVLNLTAPLSNEHGLEVGGNIWKSERGWRYTMPHIGGSHSVKLSASNIGYHTHPHGDLFFSNKVTELTGDSVWVESARKPLYLGVQNGGSVKIGVCEPGSCPHYGQFGTPPSRVIQ